ncbi:hypothetical protein L1887_09764 [Cichorium endivia]|nr:hypothetical protein L1887_09764 [Cichorium endivia]
MIKKTSMDILDVFTNSVFKFIDQQSPPSQAKYVYDLGTLKEAKKIFDPGWTNLYSALTYYFYEFVNDDQRVALAAAINSGKDVLSYKYQVLSCWPLPLFLYLSLSHIHTH